MKALVIVLFHGALAISAAELAVRGAAAAPTAAIGQECNILVADDVKAVTAIDAARLPRDTTKGANGTCANFFTADGQTYLTVSRFNSSAEYDAAIMAVLRDVYPTKEPVGGLGDSAQMFKGTSNARLLFARKGDAGLVLAPKGTGMSMSDAQLRQLAERALARIGSAAIGGYR